VFGCMLSSSVTAIAPVAIRPCWPDTMTTN
jgi:hypothetical protein